MPRVYDFGWLDFDVPERRQLSDPPVVAVIMALRFHPVLKVDQQDFVASFQEAVRADFPVFNKAPAPPSIQIQVPGAILDPAKDIPPSWIFEDVTRGWKVILSRDLFGFETQAYSGFEEFKARLGPVLEALLTHVVPTLGTRIGLRFLDEIRPSEAAVRGPNMGENVGSIEWSRYVRSDLLGIDFASGIRTKLYQSLHQILLRDQRGVGINITHGMVPSGTLLESPMSEQALSREGPFYALDIDAFQEVERRNEFTVNRENVLDRLDDLHEAISRIFRWSLNEDYLDSLTTDG